jgi:plastocyanin
VKRGLAVLCAALAVVVATADARPAARMLVYAQEWSLWPSRASLPAGRVTVQLYNRGEDAHDLRIRRVGHKGPTQTIATTQSGDLSQATWHIAPGTYELYCSLPGHRAKGMHVTLRVY